MSQTSLAIIATVRNFEGDVAAALAGLHATASSITKDLQLLVVDMGSDDATTTRVEDALSSIPDTELLCLADLGEGIGSRDYAFLAGMEHAIAGDVVVLMDLKEDGPDTLPSLVAAVRSGQDVATAEALPSRGTIAYHLCSLLYRGALKLFGLADPRQQTSRYRAMSRRATAHLLRHDASAIALLPSLKGFKSVVLPRQGRAFYPPARRSLADGARMAIGMMTTSSAAPLKMATMLCSLGAIFSLLQSAWAMGVYVLKGDVAPGWTTLSLQQSIMFLLLSLAVGALAEYVGGLSRSGRPPYHVLRQISSPMTSSRDRLNVTGE